MTSSTLSASKRPERIIDNLWNPLDFIKKTRILPSFYFKWGYPNEKEGRKLSSKLRGKRRVISYPNKEMKQLHSLFETFLKEAVEAMGKNETYGIRYFPSATGCVKESNPLLNAKLHKYGEHFYITDFAHAYQSIDLRRLTILLVYIVKYDHYHVDCPISRLDSNISTQEEIANDPLFPKMESFVKFAFSGYAGIGLAVGGPLSPYLLNLYCEVFLDQRLRYFIRGLPGNTDQFRKIVYSRYVDDLVFSSGEAIKDEVRSAIRKDINTAGFEVKHRKSFVLSRNKGAVFITKYGMQVKPLQKQKEVFGGESEERPVRKLIEGTLTFPKKKRSRLRGIIRNYLAKQWRNDIPEVITGLIAEFMYYWKNVRRKTASDRRLMQLCKKFEKKAEPYLQKLRFQRTRMMARRAHIKKWHSENRLRGLRQS